MVIWPNFQTARTVVVEGGIRIRHFGKKKLRCDVEYERGSV